MRLYLLQDDLVTRADAATTASADAFARIHWANPLTEPPVVSAGSQPARIVLFSGWFEETADAAPEVAASDPRRGIFPSSHHTWGPGAWSALDQLCDGLAPALRACGQTACFRPHARHILADPQSCLAFLRRRENQPFELLLEPAAFLTEAMLGRVEDHLARAFEALAAHPRTAALLLSNVRGADSPDANGHGGFEYAPLSSGIVDPALLVSLARRHAGHLPWIILDQGREAQLALLDP